MKKPNLTKRNEVFNQQIETPIVSSRYDLSERRVGSYRMGVLYPIYCRNDILPGDRFSMSAAPFVRFMPLVSPALTNVNVEIRYFFVPYRLLWTKWKSFISPNTSDDLNLIEPFVPNYVWNKAFELYNVYNVAGSLYDYMGVSSINWSKDGSYSTVNGRQNWYDQPGVGVSAPIKEFDTSVHDFENNYPLHYPAYPFLAYNFIWNEYFRDENLDDYALWHADDNSPAEIGPHHFFLRRVNWEKDYFSSALPFVSQQIYSTPTIADNMTIEQLRETSALTKWLERQAIGGHRYQESILTHFGVRVPDEAAQLPVYLGGGNCPVQIGSVEQTSATDHASPLATLGGKATAADSMFVDNVEFKEHGVLIGLMYIRPKALYSNVNSKDLLAKSNRHDYYWPDFANLGDEAIKSNELNVGYYQFNNNEDFGYQMRYASYRTSFDRVNGQLRPTEPLESWTQARAWVNFSAPNLPLHINSDFIRCKPSNRIFADITDEDNLVGEIYTYVDATRPMPNYVDPKVD